MTYETILEEAARLVDTDRGDAYGHPAQDFGRSAALWRAEFGWDVDASKVAIAMVLLKLSREAHTHKRDNLVDACGYLRCLEKVIDHSAS